MIYHYNQTPIYYTRQGQGSALVFLHGFLESSTMWSKIIPHFIENHTVITIDLPGFGKSECVNKIHTMELMATIISEILKTETIEKASIIGHSMGGYVALALAETKPTLLNTLVLLNSNPQEDSPQRKLNRNRALDIITVNKDAFVSMAINNLFTLKERSQFSSEILKLKNEALQIKTEGIKAAIIGMRDRKDRVSILENFEGKIISISGIADPIVPIDEIIKVSEKSKITLYQIESGHMSWLTNGNEIVKFLHLIE